MARILIVGNRKLATFNRPRQSYHQFSTPPNSHKIQRLYTYLKYGTDGRDRNGLITWGNVKSGYDLVHSFNAIPLTQKPWIATFEGVFPRTLGNHGDKLKKTSRQFTLRENCFKLISLSEFAVKKTSSWNHDWSFLAEMMKKVEIIPPTIPLQKQQPKRHKGKQICLTYCGNAFARKGGIVALRLAKIAYESNFPLHINLVSKMKFGGYTDFMDKSRYEADLKLLNLPNVTFHKELPNKEVIELFRKSDFQLLATLHDTFGYSVIEGFSVGTPAIVTATCALPEFVHHEKNGYLLQVDTDELNEIRWLRLNSNSVWRDNYRLSDEYWEQLDKGYDELAWQTFTLLGSFLENPHNYEQLSHNAIAQVSNFHNPEITSERLNKLYDNILGQ